MGTTLLVVIEETAVKKFGTTDVFVSLKFFTCQLQVERRGSWDVCSVFCGWSSCVMSGYGWLGLDAIHIMVETLSLAAVLLVM